MSIEVDVDNFAGAETDRMFADLQPNPFRRYGVTGVRDDDGSITVRFGDHGPDAANVIPLPEGWNYLVRLYRPRPEVLDGSWTFPTLD